MESEKTVEKASKGKTAIAIAHRHPIIKDADKIFVFVRTCVAGAGTQAQLCDWGGMYYRMWPKSVI